MANVSQTLKKAVALKDQGKYQDAEPVYYQAIQEDPMEMENYYSLAKFYYLLPDQYHSAINYLRAGHISVKGGANQLAAGSKMYRVQVDSVLQLYDQDLSKQILGEFDPIKIYVVLADFNLCTHAGHTLLDLAARTPEGPPELLVALKKHKTVYRNRFQDMQSYRTLDQHIEMNYYGLEGARFLILYIAWNKLLDDDTPVYQFYPDEQPRKVKHMKSSF